MNFNLIRFHQNFPFVFANSSRFLSFSQPRNWQTYENERYFGYEPSAEEPWKRIKHGLTYDLRRAARRYREVFLQFVIFTLIKYIFGLVMDCCAQRHRLKPRLGKFRNFCRKTFEFYFF